MSKKKLILYIKELSTNNPENILSKEDQALLKKYNAKNSGGAIVCVNTDNNSKLKALFNKLESNGIQCHLFNLKIIKNHDRD